MKKIVLSFMLSVMTICALHAQEVAVKAGTIVPLQIANPVKAADVEEGQKVMFKVSRDINVNGQTAIPFGTIVNGTVYEAKKSAWFGTKGRLGIKISEIVMPNGTVIPLTNGDIYVTGKNKTAISVVVFLFTLVPLPCGSKAQLPNGYEIQTNVASTTTFRIE